MSLKSLLFTALHKESWWIYRQLTRPLVWTARLLFRFFLRDKTYYYGSYLGSNHRLLIFYKNVVRPQRFLKKLFYNQVFPMPRILSLADPLPDIHCSDEAAKILETFRHNGAVLLPGAYADVASHFIERYGIYGGGTVPKDDYDNRTLVTVDQRILEFMVDERFLTVFALYYGCQPYLQEPATLAITNPATNNRTTREWQPRNQERFAPWHYDTVNMVQACLLLNDITEEDTHMVIAKGDHRVHRNHIGLNDYFHSDEFVHDHYEIIHCCGPMGTLYLFDSNALHRIVAVKNSVRIYVKLMFTPGNNPSTAGRKVVVNGLDLRRLAPLQRNALKYVVSQ